MKTWQEERQIKLEELEGETHSSVVSLGIPLGSERSPRLLQRTTVSEHVQESGQRGADGRQTFSSAPERERHAYFMLLYIMQEKNVICVANRSNIETHQFFKRK